MTTKLRLTKTEISLLKQAWENPPNHIFCTDSGFRTYTKTVKWGRRKTDAAFKLKERGLVKLLESKKYSDQPYHAYGTDHWWERTFQLTEEGIDYCKEHIGDG